MILTRHCPAAQLATRNEPRRRGEGPDAVGKGGSGRRSHPRGDDSGQPWPDLLRVEREDDPPHRQRAVQACLATHCPAFRELGT